MFKTLASFLLFTVIYITVSAQEASIGGTVYEAGSETPLSAVSVYLDKTQYGTSSNGKGAYHLGSVAPGSYTLIVSSIGYQKMRREIRLLAGEHMTVDLELTEDVAELAEITVITGGKAGIKDIPGSVAYVSPKELQRFNYTDINRTLRAIPGINVQEEDGFGLRPNIGLRGTGVDRSSKITLMEDGVLMAPAPYSAPAAYYFPTVGRMQGVEILKGSSQIKYGPYTTGGAINLISTQIPKEFSGKISLSGGSFGGRNLHAYAGNSHKNVAYLVETFQYGSDGFKKLDSGGETGFDKKDFMAKLQINTNPTARVFQSLVIKLGETAETANETYLGLTEGDFATSPYRRYPASQLDQMNTRQSQVSLTHVAKLRSNLSINTTAYRTEFARNWYKLDKVQDSAGARTGIANILENPGDYRDAYGILTGATTAHANALEMKANNRTYYTQGLQSRMDYRFKVKETVHELELGLRYHYDQVDRYQWVDLYAMDNGVMELTKTGVKGTESNLIDAAKAFASYLQYKIRMGRLTATPGLRYEHITLSRADYGQGDPGRTGSNLAGRSNTVDAYMPGIGIDYRLGSHLSTFAGIHQGFAPPGSKEETLPEKSINYELGLRYVNSGLSIQSVAFYNDYDNLLGTDLSAGGGGGSGDLFNAGKVNTNGLELQAAYDLMALMANGSFGLPLSLAYTYTDAVYLTDFNSAFEGWGQVHAGDHFPYLARHQLAIILGVEHRKGQINLSGKYMGQMRTIPGQGQIPAHEKTDAYFVIDAGAQLLLSEQVNIFVTATNLSNEVYEVSRRPAGLRPGMPRAITIGLRATF